jgi:plasmid stabilization system protein ParE
MVRVVWTGQALTNLEVIRAYIAQSNPQSAAKVAFTIKAAGDGLDAFPHRGRAVAGTNIREITRVYPYIIRYRIDAGAVFILRVRHAARRPTAP